MNKKRYLTIIFGLLFVAAAVCWLLYVPANPQCIYKAIPPEADFISTHWQLAQRADTMLENRLVTSLATGLGWSNQEVEDILNDPEFHKWLDRIASDECVLAHIPPGVSSANSCWVLAAWLGSRAQRLRWTLELYAPDECRIYSIAGSSVWRLDLNELPAGQQLYVAIEEGVVLAALSDTPRTIHQLLETYLGTTWSAMKVREEWIPPTVKEYAKHPDQCWIFPKDIRSNPVHLKFKAIAKTHIAGDMRILKRYQKNSILQESIVGQPAPFSLDSSIAQIMLTKENLAKICAGFSKTPGVALIRSLSQQIQAGPLLASCLTGAHQGLLMGFSVPGILIAVPVNNEADTLTAVLAKIDRINAMYSLGLIHRKTQVADADIYIIEGSGDNLYGDLPNEEQIAFTINHGILFVGSHPALLTKIVTGELGGSQKGSIWKQLTEEKNPDFAWFDLDKTAKTIRFAISIYSIKVMSDNSSDINSVRKNIEYAKAWIDALVPYQHAKLWSEPTPDGSSKLQFSLGPD